MVATLSSEEDSRSEEKLDRILAMQAELAVGFTRFTAKVDSIESRLERLESRLTCIEGHFAITDSQMTNFELRMVEAFERLDKRLTRLTGGLTDA